MDHRNLSLLMLFAVFQRRPHMDMFSNIFLINIKKKRFFIFYSLHIFACFNISIKCLLIIVSLLFSCLLFFLFRICLLETLKKTNWITIYKAKSNIKHINNNRKQITTKTQTTTTTTRRQVNYHYRRCRRRCRPLRSVTSRPSTAADNTATNNNNNRS